MKDYQKRVVKEKKELDKKIITLTIFLFSDLSENIPNKQRDLMEDQLYAMADYSIILGNRIDDFV